MSKITYTLDKAEITDYKNIDSVPIIICDNVFASYSFPLKNQFAINPSCGDSIKVVLVESKADTSLLSIIPIEIKIRNLKFKISVDYNKVEKELNLRLKDKKPFFSFSSSISEKDKFKLDLDEIIASFLKPYARGSLY